jgi:hypothetical protein
LRADAPLRSLAPYLSRVPWSRYATPLRWLALWFQLPLLTLFLKLALLLLRTKLLLTFTLMLLPPQFAPAQPHAAPTARPTPKPTSAAPAT